MLIFALGSMVQTSVEMLSILQEAGINPTVVNARFAKPFDTEYLMQHMKDYKLVVTMEENVITGGMGQQIHTFLYDNGYEGEVMNVAIPDEFVQHGNVDTLKEMLHIDAKSVAAEIINRM